MKKTQVRDVLPLDTTKQILLVNPAFPIPPKSRNHKDYLPVGLLKIASWLQDNDYKVKLVYGNRSKTQLKFVPDEVWITSLFTYWSDDVVSSAEHYHDAFPDARIVVGGVYATLMHEDCERRTKCHAIQDGVHSLAEGYYPDYSLLKNGIDFQIVHASRGCIRKCKFCYTHVIEREYEPKCSILPEITQTNGLKITLNASNSGRHAIKRKGLVFYDNNLLANENIDDLLHELADLRRRKLILWCESQSGFDGRILMERPELARLLREAGFRVPRIAWDWALSQKESIGRQIHILEDAGYQAKEIFIFMIYNWGIPFLEMEEKRKQCLKWHVQISDCRYRPIDQLFDHYSSHIEGQTSKDYHIHTSHGWDDALVKMFRKNVREQNICVRHGFDVYVKEFETERAPKSIIVKVSKAKTLTKRISILKQKGYHYWNPRRTRVPRGYDMKTAKPLLEKVADLLQKNEDR